jgi:transposase-like protein
MDGQNVERRVRPIRFKCALCGSTHALLPYVLVPYSPFSLRFMLCALAAYFERGTTVLAVCQRFGIAVSTLYEWKGRLLRHMGVLLGILGDLEERAPAFIAGLLASARAPRMLDGFYQRLGFSFMQRIRAAARGRPP